MKRSVRILLPWHRVLKLSIEYGAEVHCDPEWQAKPGADARNGLAVAVNRASSECYGNYGAVHNTGLGNQVAAYSLNAVAGQNVQNNIAYLNAGQSNLLNSEWTGSLASTLNLVAPKKPEAA